MIIRVKSKEEIQKLMDKNNYNDSRRYSFSFCWSMFKLCGRYFEAKEDGTSPDGRVVYIIRGGINSYALYKEWVDIVPSIIEVDDED
ncbi:MAG TPA: hypothetical protein PK151_06290 [Caldisericia bacterium]|nr:hypothetical protein [Caldisericia bacterium]